MAVDALRVPVLRVLDRCLVFGGACRWIMLFIKEDRGCFLVACWRSSCQRWPGFPCDSSLIFCTSSLFIWYALVQSVPTFTSA